MRDTLGRYELLTPLSMGGMAELHLACMPGPGGFRKFVALKQVLPDVRRDEQFVKMFLDEARLTAALNHPNIGQVFDLGEEDGELFLAMEFIAGVTLGQVLKRAIALRRPLPPGFACRVVRDACLALHQAHTFKDPATEQPMPIVHRDIAPKNIMVTFEGVVKVIDFGIAKARGRLIRTQAGQVKGTVPYMSPEQLMDKPLDGRSDLFSLGVVLWELLAGRYMHRGNEEAVIMHRIVHDVAPRLSTVGGVSDDLADLVVRVLARDPQERFQTARDFARALEKAPVELFDEEETGKLVLQLFPETLTALRSLLSAAQQPTIDDRALTTQVKLLRKADQVTSGAEPAHPPQEALATGPVPTRPAPVAPGRRLSPGLLAAGALGVIALVGAGVVLSSTSEKAPPHPRAQQGDAALVDGERARQMEQALTSGDLARLEALVASCGDEPERCRQSLAVADELTRMRAATCDDGRPVFEVFAAAGEAARRGKWATVREGLEPCRGPTGVGFRGEEMHARAKAELTVADELDRAEALLRAGGTATELNAAARRIDSMYTTTSSEPRRRALALALASAAPSPGQAPSVVEGAGAGTPPPDAAQPHPLDVRRRSGLVDGYLSEARSRMREGNFKFAASLLEQCLKTDPGAYNCHKLLGSAYASIGAAEASTKFVLKGMEHYQLYVDLAPPDERDVPKVRKLVEAYKNRSR